jgi:hypothetical protein
VWNADCKLSPYQNLHTCISYKVSAYRYGSFVYRLHKYFMPIRSFNIYLIHLNITETCYTCVYLSESFPCSPFVTTANIMAVRETSATPSRGVVSYSLILTALHWRKAHGPWLRAEWNSRSVYGKTSHFTISYVISFFIIVVPIADVILVHWAEHLAGQHFMEKGQVKLGKQQALFCMRQCSQTVCMVQ